MLSEGGKTKASALLNLQAIQDRVDARQYEKSIVSTSRNFSAWCEDREIYTPFPIEFLSIGSYIVDKVSKLNGSSKSARRWVSHLRTFSLMQGFHWLNTADERRLQKVIQELEFLDRNPTRRMMPLTKDINSQILKNQEIPLPIKTCITIGREGILRGGELCGLQRKHFIWSVQRDRVTLHLERTKTRRAGNGEFVSLKRHSQNSGVSILEEHFNKFNLWDASAESVILPSFSKSKGINWSRSISMRQLRSSIRDSLNKIGINGDSYGAHSLRAGGATDLFRAGVYYPTIKKFGRWKTDAALLYYRDQEQTTDIVMEAFSK